MVPESGLGLRNRTVPVMGLDHLKYGPYRYGPYPYLKVLITAVYGRIRLRVLVTIYSAVLLNVEFVSHDFKLRLR